MAYYHGNKRYGCSHYIPLGDLEETVALELKKIKLSDEFIKTVIQKAKDLVLQSRENRDKEIKVLRSSIIQLENKKNILEDNLLDQTIDKETFRRKHNELIIQIQNLENEIATIENQQGFDVDAVSEILTLATNIYITYKKANFEAKRHYLSIFFEKIEIKDKKVASVTYTPLFQRLIEANKVRVSNDWLRAMYDIRTFYTQISAFQQA